MRVRDIPAALGDSVRQRTLTAMYREHHGWLHGWLRRKLGCSQHAADLAHDAFIRVLMLAEPQHIQEPRAFLATTAGRLPGRWRASTPYRKSLHASAGHPV